MGVPFETELIGRVVKLNLIVKTCTLNSTHILFKKFKKKTANLQSNIQFDECINTKSLTNQNPEI